MVQQNIDFIGGGFKLTFPYTFGGWIFWIVYRFHELNVSFGEVLDNHFEWSDYSRTTLNLFVQLSSQ